MSALVKVDLGAGRFIYLEADNASLPAAVVEPQKKTGTGLTSGGKGDTQAATSQIVVASLSFQDALDNVRPVAEKVIDKLKNLPDPADEVEVEFGISVNAQAGVVIARAGVDANFKVSLKWKKSDAE